MRAADLWGRVRRGRPRHQRRGRMAHFGELVQLDGSFRDWFEGRGPRPCVMTMVDDATGRTLLRFGAEETTWAAATILHAWIAAYGVRLAVYTDWKNVYLRAPTNNERARGAAPLTQCGRMCTKLGITLIGAASPQAKGRVARGHGTHQDRLIKKLRLRGIATVDRRVLDAEIFCLETSARSATTMWCSMRDARSSSDHRARGRVPAKSKVLVRELADGTLRVVYVARDGRERVLPWTAAPARVTRPRTIPSPAPCTTPQGVWVPAADHPWRSQHRRWKGEATVRRAIPADTELHPDFAP